MDKITLYSTGCQKCVVLKTLLTQAKLQFTLVEDAEKTTEVAQANGITTPPVLEVNGNYHDFSSAVKYLRERK
jgi:glutaredoxin